MGSFQPLLLWVHFQPHCLSPLFSLWMTQILDILSQFHRSWVSVYFLVCFLPMVQTGSFLLHCTSVHCFSPVLSIPLLADPLGLFLLVIILFCSKISICFFFISALSLLRCPSSLLRISVLFFFSLVSGMFIIAYGNICIVTSLKSLWDRSSQHLTSSWCWHLLVAFFYSFCCLSGSCYDKWFLPKAGTCVYYVLRLWIVFEDLVLAGFVWHCPGRACGREGCYPVPARVSRGPDFLPLTPEEGRAPVTSGGWVPAP